MKSQFKRPTKISEDEDDSNAFKKATTYTSFGGGTTKSRKPSSSTPQQIDLLSALKRNKSKIKKRETETLWEQVTKSYFLHGVPRLFGDK